MRRSPFVLLSLRSPATTSLLTLLLCLLILSTLGFAAAPDRIVSPVVARQSIQLPAGVPQRAQPQFDRGPVDPSLKLRNMTLLTVPSASQQKAINRLLAQQQDPRSPLYHKWLTPEQYADRFGLSPNDITKITAWLQSQGFSIGKVARGRNWVTFNGTAAQAEAAFQTTLHTFDVDGEAHFANTSAPAIPAALSGIVAGVRGLNNFRPRSHALRLNPDLARPDYTTSSGNLFIAPGDIATMYNITPLYTAGYDGTGQTLAVLGETDVYLADINDFRTGFGLSTISGCTTNSNNVITACNSTNFKYRVVPGNTDPGSPNSLQDDLAEADIDIEWSGAVARNAQIIYVNAPQTGVFDSLYDAVDNTIAPVMTLSYGQCELDEIGFFASDETELQKANSEGLTVLNSSGDSGAAECDYTSSPAVGGYSVSYPASSPEVTGVGGTLIPFSEYTTQYWNAGNNANGGSLIGYTPEYGWNDPQDWGAFCAAASGNCTGFPFSNWQTAQTYYGILGGGGGVSNCTSINGSGACLGGFSQPSYQAGLSISGQAAGRFSPDISLLSSIYFPGFVVCTPQSEVGGSGSASTCAGGIPSAVVCTVGTLCSVFGGTSVASPMFAGIVTLMNQYLVANSFQSTAGLSNINPSLYHMAVYNQPAFHQVTTGSNGAFCTAGTPANQPVALQCPSSGTNAGFLGFDASNFDAASGYNLVTGLGSVDVNKLATAWGELLTATTTSLSPSATQISLGDNETITITVTPSAASGVVKLYNNGSSSAFGTATITGGTGTFSTTTLPPGANSIVGIYTGTDASSTSSAVIVTVTAPTFTFVSIGSSTHTVLSGQTSLTYTFKATPTSGSTFVNPVTLSCSFSPTDTTLKSSSCAFSPSATIAAGSGITTVTMAVTTTGPNTGTGTQLRHRSDNRSPWLPLTLPIAGVVMLGLARGKLGSKASKRSLVALLLFSLALLGFMVACGGGGGGGSNPVTVAVSPGTASLWPNDTADSWPSSTQAFSATVSNTTNTAVTWSISPSTAGSIDSSGIYTAPTVASGLPASVTVTATSQADASKSASSVVTLKAATIPQSFGVVVTATESGATPQSPAVTLVVQ